MAPAHPFDPIRPEEIQETASILRAAWPGTTLRFKTIETQEPIKKDVIPFIEAERLGHALPSRPARITYILFHRLDNGKFLKALVNLDTKQIISQKELAPHVQGPVDVDEMIEMEGVCLRHPDVQREIEKMQLPKGVTVCNDPWIYGTDDINESRRLYQCYMYIVPNEHPQTNQYSLPCTFSPVFDGNTMELVRIDYLPMTEDHQGEETKPWKPTPAIDSHKARPSMWTAMQKWRLRVGYNYRDGLVLYNVTYDRRNTFYRLSMAEMTVPYGDPREPYHRKQAFDVGDVGLGINCNQLSLGCDCLGHIKYFDGWRPDSKGNPVQMKNVICMHEQDAGILHKHTNYRNMQATVVRNRQLVIQMICTVSNYEYIFAWILDQAGGIEFEVRATGILSTMPINNETGFSVPWSTNVGPGVTAPNHQHIFSLRIDPAIDGFKNTVVYEDSVPLPADYGVADPWGCGYIAKTSVIEKSGNVDGDVAKARVFKIRNDNIINKVSGFPVSYKIKTLGTQKMIMSKASFNNRRAKFSDHDVWVTKYQDDELYPAGEFTNQSRHSEGVEVWSKRDDSVLNEDVVFWHTFGLTHNPRPEDFPVMPVERISVHMMPSSFHEKNPALDVPPSNQAFNRSVQHPDAQEVKKSCCNTQSRL